jgi:protein-S-isoprenylcysteine O-methyltransferase Ste14
MTDWLHSARAWLALLIAALTPGLFVYWLSIHPFIRFWRRFPPARTMALHVFVWILLAVPVVRFRRVVLGVDFGPNVWLALLGLAALAASVRLRRGVAGDLPLRTLTGVAELRGEAQLVTGGIYARIRHPRYVQIVLALLGYALLTNFLAAYVAAALTALWVRLMVPFEERELRERFGASYDEYAARVPRFFPRRRQVQATPSAASRRDSDATSSSSG